MRNFPNMKKERTRKKAKLYKIKLEFPVFTPEESQKKRKKKNGKDNI